MSINTTNSTKLIVEAIHELGNKIDKLEENLSNKLDKIYDATSNSLTTLHNEYANQNKALEIELTLGIKDFLLDYAASQGLKYSYKTGRNYPKKIKDPRENNNLITDLDGSYILSNDRNNARVENAQMKNDMNVLLNARLSILSKKIAHEKMNSVKRSEEIQNMKKALRKYSSITKETTNMSQFKESLGSQNVTENKRYLVIVESKQCLSQALLEEDIWNKMVNIIRFFIDVNLYYKSKIYNQDAASFELYTQEFQQLCENYNLNFDGIVFVIGGGYITENIKNTFKEACGKFNSYLIKRTHESIVNSQKQIKHEYVIWRERITRDYLFNLFIDHHLVLVNGSRFKQEARLFPNTY